MKLLLCGPICDFSGYSTFSRNLAKSLSYANSDLVLRAISYDQRDNGDKFIPPSWMDLALKRPLQDIDLLLQVTTPNIEAVPKPGICNGLAFFWESDRLPPTWLQIISQFDFLLVASRYNAQMLANCGITKPILVCPFPFEGDLYTQSREPYPLQNTGHRTIFYNISQLSTKKGIDALLRAYYAAFADRPDEVLLVLKTYVNMQDRSNDLATLRNFIDVIKRGCRLPIEKHPPIMPILDILPDEDIQRLHKACHAYVCSSRSEGYCVPALESLAHGNTLISNMYGGLAEFVSEKTSLVYNGCLTNCFDMHHPDPSIYTGLERWWEPSVAEMSTLMKSYHLLRKGAEEGNLSPDNQTKWAEVQQRAKTGSELVQHLDYKRVGPLLLHQLESGFNAWKQTGKVNFNV